MSATLPADRCNGCGAELAPTLLACPGCGRLVHREALSNLTRGAAVAEAQGDLTSALSQYREACALLPAATVQRATLERRMARLSAAIDGRAGVDSNGQDKGAAGGIGKVAGALGVVGVLLLKSKALLGLLVANAKLLILGLAKLPTLLSMLVYARFSAGQGLGFGIGIGRLYALRAHGRAALHGNEMPQFPW